MTYLRNALARVRLFFLRLGDGLIRWRWLTLLAIAAITAVMVVQMGKLRMDNSNEAFLMEGDASRATQETFRQLFGNDDFIYLLIALPPDRQAFEPQIHRRVGQLVGDLERQLPWLRRVNWIGNLQLVDGVPEGIHVHTQLETWPDSPRQVEKIRRRMLSEPSVVDNLLARDGRSLALYLEFDPYPEDEEDPRKQVMPVLQRILDDYGDLTVYAVGSPIIDVEFDRIAGEETERFGLATLAVIILFLALVTRSVLGVLIPLLVTVLALIWTLGLVGALGWPLIMLAVMLPTLLVCVGVSDSMHLIADFQHQMRNGQERGDAVKQSLLLVSKPVLFTSITTAVGFLSFIGVPVKPLGELGIYAAVGVMFGLLLSLTLGPVLLSFGRPRASGKKTAAGGRESVPYLTRITLLLARFSVRYAKTVVLGFVLVTIAAVVGMGQVEVETDTISSLDADQPIRLAYDTVDQRMGGSMTLELMLTSPYPDGVKDARFVRQMEQLQRFIDGQEVVTRTHSMLDLLRQVNRALHADDPAWFRVPESTAHIAEQLFLYEGGGGQGLDRLVSLNYDRARITCVPTAWIPARCVI